MRLRLAILALGLLSLTGCPGGGGGGGASNNPSTPGQGPLPPVVVNSNECAGFFDDSDPQGQMARDIGFGDAACVKRDIQTGKVNINAGDKDFGSDSNVPFIFKAISEDSLFFVNAKYHRGDVVVQVLADAGEDMTVLQDGETVLQTAMTSDQVGGKYPEIVSALIGAKSSSLNSYDSHGWTPYHTALSTTNQQWIDAILAKGVSINQTTKNGTKAFSIALDYMGLDQLKVLKARGIDVVALDSQKNSFLTKAVQGSDAALVNTLIADKQIDVNTVNSQNDTALLIALRNGNAPIASALMDAGANAALGRRGEALRDSMKNKMSTTARLFQLLGQKDDVDGNGEGYLDYAVRLSDVDSVKMFLAAGFDVNQTVNGAGGTLITPLSIAAFGSSPELVQVLLRAHALPELSKSPSVPTLLFGNSNAQITQLLIDAGVQVNVRNSSGKTALALSVLSGNEEVVAVLLRNGAKTTIQDNGSNVLCNAISAQNFPMVRELIDGGFKVNELDSFNRNSLFCATVANSIDLLVSYGVNVNQIDTQGASFLANVVKVTAQEATQPVVAAEKEDLLMIQSLVRAKASLKWSDPSNGDTLLQIALEDSFAYSPYMPVFEDDNQPGIANLDLLATLLDAGADPSAPDHNGTPALLFADSLEEVKFLLARGVDKNLTDRNGNTLKEVFLNHQDMAQFKLEELQKDVADLEKQLQSETDKNKIQADKNIIDERNAQIDKVNARLVEVQQVLNLLK